MGTTRLKNDRSNDFIARLIGGRRFTAMFSVTWRALFVGLVMMVGILPELEFLPRCRIRWIYAYFVFRSSLT